MASSCCRWSRHQNPGLPPAIGEHGCRPCVDVPTRQRRPPNERSKQASSPFSTRYSAVVCWLRTEMTVIKNPAVHASAVRKSRNRSTYFVRTDEHVRSFRMRHTP
jgi:hypothetical protein